MFERAGERAVRLTLPAGKNRKKQPYAICFVSKTFKNEPLQNYGIPPRQLESDPVFLIFH